MVVAELNGIVERIPGGGAFPPMDVLVNYRLVDSSNIDRIGWDNAGNMYVRFKASGLYCYMGVSRQRAVACAYAESVGRYLHQHIKNAHAVLKLGV